MVLRVLCNAREQGQACKVYAQLIELSLWSLIGIFWLLSEGQRDSIAGKILALHSASPAQISSTCDPMSLARNKSYIAQLYRQTGVTQKPIKEKPKITAFFIQSICRLHSYILLHRRVCACVHITHINEDPADCVVNRFYLQHHTINRYHQITALKVSEHY